MIVYLFRYFLGIPEGKPGQLHLYRVSADPSRNGAPLKLPQCLTCPAPPSPWSIIHGHSVPPPPPLLPSKVSWDDEERFDDDEREEDSTEVPSTPPTKRKKEKPQGNNPLSVT